MKKPPQFPWKKGQHPDYTCFSVEVQVCQDQQGQVWSLHDFEEEDLELCHSLPHLGVQQVAYALLTEALRSEAYVSMLIKMQQDNDLLAHWSNATEQERQEMERELAMAAVSVMSKTLSASAENIAKETFSMLAGQIEDGS